MNKHINTFSTGINRDVSMNKYPNTSYYWAQNLRLVAKDELSTGTLTNVDGTVPKLNIGSGNDIKGYCVIRNILILFVNNVGGGRIYIWNSNNSDALESPTLIYSNAGLDFSRDIIAVGRYENENVQKVYFTDGETFFKQLNIVHPTLGLGASLNAYEPESLDMVVDVAFSDMALELQQGGNLKAGKIQYAYQLYSVRGTESVFSPASNLIHLTSSDEGSNSNEYGGSEVGESINKSVVITIDGIDSLFTRLRLVALEYTVLYQQPSIRIVGEYDIEGLTSLTITDTGLSIGEIIMEEFRFLQNNFYPKTLDIKDNYLFAANIKNNYFDISDDDFDARAFRANGSDVIEVYNDNTKVTISHTAGVIDENTLPDITDEQFNLFNNVTENDYSTTSTTAKNLSYSTQEFKYKPGSAGTILGGKGVNIEYEFITEAFVLDNSVKAKDFPSTEAGSYYPRIKVGVTSPYENNAAPDTNVGYHRDEVYRFGIIFLDTKGRESFVKWIGDIRFPSNRDPGYSYIYYDSVNNIVMGRNLGIRFSVNIPNEIKPLISGYRIVRAERTTNDKTIICQGLVGYPFKGATGSTYYNLASTPTVADLRRKFTYVKRITEDIDPISRGNHYVENNSNFVFNPNYVEFNSPDIVINKPKLPTANSFIEVFGTQNYVETSAICGVRGYEDGSPGTGSERDMLIADKPRNVYVDTNIPKIRGMVNSARLFTPKTRGNSNSNDETADATKTVLNDGIIYNNCVCAPRTDDSTPTKFGLRGTHMLLGMNNELPLTADWESSTDKIRFLLANYKVNKGRSIYGGSSYEARMYSKYYPVSGFVSKDTDTSFNDPTPAGSALIQIIDSFNTLLTNSSTYLISTAKQFDFYISNYGTEPLTIGTLTLSNTTDWYFADYPTGILSPGETAHGLVIYSGEESGVASNIVTVNTDATNTNPFIFVLGVDYVTNPADYAGSAIPPNVSGTDNDPNLSGLKVYNGDTYINYFVYMRGIYDIERPTGSRIESYVFYPVESSINLALRLDKMQEYINWGFYRDSKIIDYKLMETPSMGVSFYSNNYPVELGNLYRYNSAYSSIDKSKEYYSRPLDFTDTKTFDTRIVVSDKKINGEYTDNWTKFKFNNYLDVDGRFDAITKIITFKNNLFFFQPTAVGIASVNQRSLIQDNQPGQLVLGTAGILSRYDYITDKSGSENYHSIITSDDYIYYADKRRKRFNKLVPGKEEAISVVKGIDSLLFDLSWNNVRCGFDKGYNEVILSIDDTTLCFNEMADAFISSYTFQPGIMFSINNNFFSTALSDEDVPWLVNNFENVLWSDAEEDYIILSDSGLSSTLFKHNVGDKGTFNINGSDEVGESYITLIINPSGNNIFTFDNVDLRTDVYTNANVDVFNETINKLEFENNYQSYERDLSNTNAFTTVPTNPSAGITSSTGAIKRIGRVWRAPLVPNLIAGSNYRRMVDTYLKLTLRYDNSTNNNFRLHDVTSYVRGVKV